MGEDSSQTFGTTARMTEDQRSSVTKRVRLVVSKKRQPYVHSSTRDLTTDNQGYFDDPIPPKINNNNNARSNQK